MANWSERTVASEERTFDWIAIIRHVWQTSGRNRTGMVAAGVSFYGLLALFPSITAIVTVAGIVFSADQITATIQSLSSIFPKDAENIILAQVKQITETHHAGLSLTALGSLVLAVYSASQGTAGLVEGIAMSVGQQDRLSFFRLLGLRIALMLLVFLGVLLALTTILVLPAVLSTLDLAAETGVILNLARWVVFFGLTIVGISIFFRLSYPSSQRPEKWFTPGAILACLVWVGCSVAFSYYVANFGNYNASFGALAGVVVLMIWFWLSAYIVLLGAELDAALQIVADR